MKHSLLVTLILVAVFLVSQLIGLGLIAAGTVVSVSESGERTVSHEDTALGPRPQNTGLQVLFHVGIGIAIGTGLILFLIRYNLVGIWRVWFFVAVWLASTVSLGAILPVYVAMGLAFALAAWKIFRPNVIVHNVTEVLVYTGIVLLIAPMFDTVPSLVFGVEVSGVVCASILLIGIALYDAYAVWKSKHMVAMAQFQTKSKLFAGLLVPYSTKGISHSMKTVPAAKAAPALPTGRTAILGGGDIAFPMLFTGVVLSDLVQHGFAPFAAYGLSLVVVACATLSLLLLFLFAKEDAFYPAMPFLAAGCFVGYALVSLLV